MKAKILAAAIAAFFVVVVPAQAFHYHLRFSQAKHGTREVAIRDCEEDNKCVGFAIGECRRISDPRIDCIEANFDETVSGELECNTILHWGVEPGGYVKFRYGHVHCFYVE